MAAREEEAASESGGGGGGGEEAGGCLHFFSALFFKLYFLFIYLFIIFCGRTQQKIKTTELVVLLNVRNTRLDGPGRPGMGPMISDLRPPKAVTQWSVQPGSLKIGNLLASSFAMWQKKWVNCK